MPDRSLEFGAPVRVLLLQARLDDDPAADEEVASFVARSAGKATFETHSLLTGPPPAARLERFDCLMVGGSGDFYVSRGNLPEFGATLDLFRTVAESGFPMFASCFGFQCLVAALGGEIVYDPEATEVGTFELELTAAGLSDRLLGDLPVRFLAQMGRKDRALRLPEGAIHLARSERCPLQAFRLPDKPIWATQFHPELTGAENLRRFEIYRAGYASLMSPAEVREAVARFQDSPETTGILGRFLDHLKSRESWGG